ncbi:membrane-associated protein, putative [Bodo saltans]|uniref:Membrane-associated protein, putative n=1 Tax=Bodo saltans TaxID=75058 RepID=A0A0S4IP89_BODSA|nr:membrane-associated protein, putative [Bodo saltans]|eukprot:CUE99733.1 membrane-associated protein, putative [Bodo saltans]
MLTMHLYLLHAVVFISILFASASSQTAASRPSFSLSQTLHNDGDANDNDNTSQALCIAAAASSPPMPLQVTLSSALVGTLPLSPVSPAVLASFINSQSSSTTSASEPTSTLTAPTTASLVTSALSRRDVADPGTIIALNLSVSSDDIATNTIASSWSVVHITTTTTTADAAFFSAILSPTTSSLSLQWDDVVTTNSGSTDSSDRPLSKWHKTMLHLPSNSEGDFIIGWWVKRDISAIVDRTLILSITFGCRTPSQQNVESNTEDGVPQLIVNIGIPLQGEQRVLLDVVRTATRAAQVVAMVVAAVSLSTTPTAVASVLGRVLSTRSMTSCDSGALSSTTGGGMIDLGLTYLCGEDTTSRSNEYSIEVVEQARSAVISNIVICAVLVVLVKAFFVISTQCCLHRSTPAAAETNLSMGIIPLTLLTAISATLPSTAAACTTLLIYLVRGGAASSSGCLAVDVTLFVLGALSILVPIITVVVPSTWSSSLCEEGVTVLQTIRVHQFAWYVAFDLLIQTVISVLVATSGVHHVADSLCMSITGVVVALLLLQCVMVVMVKPFHLSLNNPFVVVCFVFVLISAAAQLAFVILTATSSSISSSPIWMIQLSAACQLFVVALCALKLLSVDFVQLMRRIVGSAGKTTPLVGSPHLTADLLEASDPQQQRHKTFRSTDTLASFADDLQNNASANNNESYSIVKWNSMLLSVNSEQGNNNGDDDNDAHLLGYSAAAPASMLQQVPAVVAACRTTSTSVKQRKDHHYSPSGVTTYDNSELFQHAFKGDAVRQLESAFWDAGGVGLSAERSSSTSSSVEDEGLADSAASFVLTSPRSTRMPIQPAVIFTNFSL